MGTLCCTSGHMYVPLFFLPFGVQLSRGKWVPPNHINLVPGSPPMTLGFCSLHIILINTLIPLFLMKYLPRFNSVNTPEDLLVCLPFVFLTTEFLIINAIVKLSGTSSQVNRVKVMPEPNNRAELLSCFHEEQIWEFLLRSFQFYFKVV